MPTKVDFTLNLVLLSRYTFEKGCLILFEIVNTHYNFVLKERIVNGKTYRT
jgi:hypothetical protein